MSSDIETFICVIENTEYMINLLFESGKLVEEYEEEINILENWENYKTIKDVVKLNNEHINNAVREILKNQDLIKELMESTDITAEEIEDLKKFIKN